MNFRKTTCHIPTSFSTWYITWPQPQNKPMKTHEPIFLDNMNNRLRVGLYWILEISQTVIFSTTSSSINLGRKSSYCLTYHHVYISIFPFYNTDKWKPWSCVTVRFSWKSLWYHITVRGFVSLRLKWDG